MATPAGIAPPTRRTRQSRRIAGQAPEILVVAPAAAAAAAAPRAGRKSRAKTTTGKSGAAGAANNAISNMWRITEDSDHPRGLIFQGENFALVPAPQFSSRRRYAAGEDAKPPKFLERAADTSIAESDGRTWHFAKRLGAGSNGAADLWLLIEDEDQVIADRMCVKNIFLENKNYHNQTMWDEGWTGSRTRPIEAIIHQRLTEAVQAETINILPLHAWHYDTERRVLKMYMEFAEHGDLDGILPQGSNMKRTGEMVESTELADWELPEPYVWWILLCLVRASLTMDRGNPSPTGSDDDNDNKKRKKKANGKGRAKGKAKKKAPAPRWRPIVHRDFKPQNIMLGPDDDHEDLGDWDLNWPRPWLADFGTSMELDHEHWQNPADYRGSAFATQGFMAPEQFDYDMGHDGEEGHPFGSWTNVWNIGMIGYWLTRGNNWYQKIDGEDYFEHIEREWGDGAPGGMYATSDEDELTYPNGCGYSEELQDPCKECVALDPADRPGLDDLLARIRQGFFNSMQDAETGATGVGYEAFHKTGRKGKERAKRRKFSKGANVGKILAEAEEELDEEAEDEAKSSKL